MTHSRADENETDEADAETAGRYGAVETGGGDTVIYDRTNEERWIQSDYAVDLGV
jgi:hypothetical protein